MIKIANRGNFCGIDEDKENTVEYLQVAISAGYSVKVDAWLLDRQWFLGTNFPKEPVTLEYLENPLIWIHAKNLEGYVSLYNNSRVHVFWHNRDEYTFTNKGIKWARFGIVTYDGIMTSVDHNLDISYKIRTSIYQPLGICCDNFNFLEKK